MYLYLKNKFVKICLTVLKIKMAVVQKISYKKWTKFQKLGVCQEKITVYKFQVFYKKCSKSPKKKQKACRTS